MAAFGFLMSMIVIAEVVIVRVIGPVIFLQVFFMDQQVFKLTVINVFKNIFC